MEPDQIKSLIQHAGHNQVSIAERIGVSQSTVNRVIFGVSTSEKVRRNIADIIGMDVRLIWPEVGDRPPGRRRDPVCRCCGRPY